MKITAIYDNLGKTVDRYTVLTDEIIKHPGGDIMRDSMAYLGCNTGGDGFSQWGELPRSVFATLLKPKTGTYRAITHLGHLTPFEALDERTQAHLAYRVFDDEQPAPCIVSPVMPVMGVDFGYGMDLEGIEHA